ncbi:MAG: FHA domain-containing protein [Deltaproteobacteria bacterium]|nr:FHA domain-containing protein [Deltaproteobacteria bacterium]
MGRFGTLVVVAPDGGEVRYSLDSPRVSIGRGADNDVVLLDIKVSRRHAVLQCSGAQLRLEDLGSSNGFKFNGNRVRDAVVRPGDEVIIGGTTLRVSVGTGIVSQEDQTLMTQVGEGFEASITDHSVPRIVVTREGRSVEYKLNGPRLVIGRQPGVDVQVEHPKVSRQHAELTVHGGGVTLRDLGSRNGTLLNGAPVESAELHGGDMFEVGDARIVFKAGFTQDDLSVVIPLPPRAGAVRSTTSTGARAVRPVSARSTTRADESNETLEAGRPAELPLVPPPTRRARTTPAGQRLPVVVVPGFMGSTLFRGDAMVWPAAKTFLKTPEMLKMPEEKDLTPRGLVEEVVVIPGLIKLDAYNRLVEYLVQGLGYQAGRDLFVCAYDWRADLRHAARHLGNLITEWEELPEKAQGKFIVIAHSAGGLVARYYVERMGGRHHIDRLVQLGVPNRGTPKPLMTMLGGGGLPFGTNRQKLKETVATFLSAYQLLPSYPVVHDEKGPVDLLNDTSWVPEKVKLAIKDAREFHEELGTSSRVPVVSIFGYGQKTLARINVKRGKDGEFIDPQFVDEDCGDGTVAQDSAILAGSEIHPVQQQHGALYTDNDVKMRLKLELLGKV